MAFAYEDEQCPARGVGLDHMRDGGRCEFCRLVLYVRRAPTPVVRRVADRPSPDADDPEERLIRYALHTRRRLEVEGPDPMDRPAVVGPGNSEWYG